MLGSIFFFQAEDGIRDADVTGVQTCALPICRPYQLPPSGRVDQPASCFATPVGGEVLVADRKLVGSAQVRKRSAFLQHGSILLDGSQEIVAAVSRTPQVASEATTLSAELGRRVTWDEVVEAAVQAWRDEGTSLAPLGVA